jgi:hypothetical protein
MYSFAGGKERLGNVLHAANERADACTYQPTAKTQLPPTHMITQLQEPNPVSLDHRIDYHDHQLWNTQAHPEVEHTHASGG